MTIKKKSKTSLESIVRQIKRKTRRKFTAEEKIRIVLEGLRGQWMEGMGYLEGLRRTCCIGCSSSMTLNSELSV